MVKRQICQTRLLKLIPPISRDRRSARYDARKSKLNADAGLSPDVQLLVGFLKGMSGGGRVHVCVKKEGVKGFPGLTFKNAYDPALDRYVANAIQNGQNVYYVVNELAPDCFDHKPARADVARASLVWQNLDYWWNSASRSGSAATGRDH